MVTLQLTDEQAINVIEQLPLEQRQRLIRQLLQREREIWEELARAGQPGARAAAAARGRDWDKMTEEERDEFIDDVLHEDR